MDGTPDISTPSETVAKDTSWFSKEDGCMEVKEVTSVKPQYVLTAKQAI
jgi:hypothetical protein